MSRTQIQIPDAYQILFCGLTEGKTFRQPARYVGYHGGRGGGKTYNIALCMLILLSMRKMKLCCARDTKDAIKDSVHSILSRLAKEHNLGWQVLATELRHPNGSVITFSGFKGESQDSNVKGLDNYDIVWCEEAHAFRANTLEFLKPTLRKEGSFFIFSWNPLTGIEPIESLFLDSAGKKIEVNWMHNPYFPDVLWQEMKRDERLVETGQLDKKIFLRTWFGVPIGEHPDSICTLDDVNYCMSQEIDSLCGFNTIQIGVDVARFGNDKSVITARIGPKVLSIEGFSGIPGDELVGKIIQTAERCRLLYPNIPEKNIIIVVDTAGPSTVLDFLPDRYTKVGVNFGQNANRSIHDQNYKLLIQQGQRPAGERFTNVRNEMIFHISDMVHDRELYLPVHATLRKELTHLKYGYRDVSGTLVRVLERKEAYRDRQNGESTDFLDSLALAYHETESYTSMIF